MPNNSLRSANTPASVDAARRGPLATPAEVSDYLGVPVKTLYQWKYRGIGPNVHKVGRHLRYRWDEVDSWVNAQSTYDLAV